MITIIVLLILAGVSITTLTGENGILTEAQEAKIRTEEGKEEENEKLEQANQMIENSIREAENGELQNIEIEVPTKTNYIVGEELDTTGMVVKAVYANGNKIDVTNEVKVSGYSKKLGGTHTITVTYVEKTATFEVTSEEIYTVKVDGVEYTKGKYNTKVTITAEEEKEGKKFSGWKIGDVVVSTDLTLSFAIASNLDLTKIYGETLELTPKALMSNMFMLKRADNKVDVKMCAKLVVPPEYGVIECGVFWTSANESKVPYLHDENGEVYEGGKKTISPTINKSWQFSLTVNGMPEGRTLRGVVFAKLRKGDEIKWVFSEEQSVTYSND